MTGLMVRWLGALRYRCRRNDPRQFMISTSVITGGPASDHAAQLALQHVSNDVVSANAFEMAVLQEAVHHAIPVQLLFLALVEWALAVGYGSPWLQDNRRVPWCISTESRRPVNSGRSG